MEYLGSISRGISRTGFFLVQGRPKTPIAGPTVCHYRFRVNKVRQAGGLLPAHGAALGLDIAKQLVEGFDELLNALVLQLPGDPLQVDAQDLEVFQ